MTMIDILVPAAGESVTEADIACWLKSDGDHVNMDDELLELETDKASMALTAEAAGQLTILVDDGETVKVGDVIGRIDTTVMASAAPSEPTPSASPAPASAPPQPSPSGHYATGHPSPAASNVLSSAGLSPADVVGTGKDGRITKPDAEAAKATLSAGVPSSPTQDTIPPLTQTGTTERSERHEKMSRLRRTVAQRLVNAQHTQALLSTFNEVDLTEVMAIRSRHKESFKEKYTVNLGFMSFFTTAVCRALQEFPIMNARVDGDHIVYHDYCDIGIAVASSKGLVVPVIRSADQLSFRQIEDTIVHYAKKARSGQISIDDMEGGTFTITNGGTFGSMLSTPIVNFPQSAILGMHNIVQRPVAVNGEVVIRPMMYLAVSYDHRIIDGSDAVRFLVNVKDRLEDPARLLIGL